MILYEYWGFVEIYINTRWGSESDELTFSLHLIMFIIGFWGIFHDFDDNETKMTREYLRRRRRYESDRWPIEGKMSWWSIDLAISTEFQRFKFKFKWVRYDLILSIFRRKLLISFGWVRQFFSILPLFLGMDVHSFPLLCLTVVDSKLRQYPIQCSLSRIFLHLSVMICDITSFQEGKFHFIICCSLFSQFQNADDDHNGIDRVINHKDFDGWLHLFLLFLFLFFCWCITLIFPWWMSSQFPALISAVTPK
jgi:hypothetical protein